MTKYIVLIISTLILFTDWDCKKNPVGPGDTNTDTTSHDFTWTTYTLGDGSRGSSTLYDVAIINDTLSYAVGEIYLKDSYTYDSLGNWIDPYNIAKWNGNSWELMRVRYNFQLLFPNGTPGMLYTKVTAIYAFSANDIWIAAGTVQHYNGHTWIEYAGNGAGSANKIWGSDSSNLYFVCNAGTIIHYNGSSWSKVESGTTLDIHDIYGAYNSMKQQWEILAVASTNYPLDKTILQIQGTSATTISSDTIQYELYSVWLVPCQQYYVIGDGIYQKNSLSDKIWRNNPLDITTFATTKITGNGINDVIVCGAFGEMLHYNGSTWKSYKAEVGITNGAYGSVAIRNNLVIAVGMDSPQAMIAMGRR